MKTLNRLLLSSLPTRVRRPFLIKKLLEIEIGQKQALIEACTPSNTALDIVIPVTERDLPIFPYVIEGLKKNLYHPINKILVLGPPAKSIISTCQAFKVDFINEDEVLHLKKQDLHQQFNNRAGWWFQQFLKLYCHSFIQTEYYLVLDADTVLLRPHLFLKESKRIFNISDEFHRILSCRSSLFNRQKNRFSIFICFTYDVL